MKHGGNFGDLPKEHCEFEQSKVVLISVPYDGTSTWQKGAACGPSAIIEASGNMELYDIETDSEVYRVGIYTDEPVTEGGTAEKMVEAVRERVKERIDDGKFTVVIGGEHSVSIGAMQAHAEAFGEISILQLDAHSDLREEYNGSRHNHACVMARVRELGTIVQAGIRSMDACEKAGMKRGNVFFAREMTGDSSVAEKIISKLSEKVYVTIDLDVFDPSIMPSTGTPEPGGLLWYDVLGILREVFERKEVVGFDVVELCPNKNNKGPDFLAAKLIYKLLGYKFRGKDE